MNQRTFEVPESFLEDLNKRLDVEERKKRPFFWWLCALLGGIWLFFTLFFILRADSFSAAKKTTTLPGSNEYLQNSRIYPSITETKLKMVFRKETFKMARPDNFHIGRNQTFVLANGTKKQKHAKPKAYFTPLQNDKTALRTGTLKIQRNKNSGAPSFPAFKAIPKEIEEVKKFTDGESDSISLLKRPVGPLDSVISRLTVPGISNDIKTNAPNSSWKKEIQIFGGLGANFVKDFSDSAAYAEKLQENQSSILAPSFGVNGNLSYKKLTFGTGLSYSQTGEKNTLEITKYYWKDSTVSEHIIDTILVLDSLGNWIEEIHDTTLYHDIQYQDSKKERTSFKNTYSWISIPLYFGYRFDVGNYEFIPRIGAQFNFGISGNRGKFPTKNFNDILEYQAVKFNVSYLIQLEIRRNFNNWHIFINPYFKSMINPAISGDLIQRRYSSWGIQFGVGLKL